MADFHITGDTSLDGSGLQQGLTSGTVAAGQIIAGLVATVANGAKNMIADVMQTGISFDSAMSQVAATMGVTRDEMGELTDFAKEMGSTTQFTATQAAEGLNYLALAGYDAKKSMATLPSVLNLAAAGGMDLGAASDMVTDAMSALGLEADEQGVNVTHFGDILAKTASSSNTSVSQLGDAILTVGGTAKGLACGTEELATALGLLADNGIKASEGGTHLRNILMAMNPTTDAAVAAWKALGISGYDADGNLRPLKDTFQDLSEAMADMTQQERDDLLSDMFNKTDLSAINALMGTNAERWEELGEAVGNAGGSMEQMADTMMDNLGGALTYLSSATDGLKLAVFDSLSGIAMDGVQMATEAVTAITDGFKTGGVAGMLDAVAQLGISFFDGLANVFGGDTTHMVAIALATMTNFTAGIRENAGHLVDAGLNMLENLATGIAENLPNLIAYAPTIVSNLAGVINDNAPKILASGVVIITTLASGIIKSIPTLVKNIPKIIKAISDVITAFNWLALGGTIITGIANGVKNLAKNIPNALKSIVTNGESVVKNFGWASLGRAVITALAQGVKALASAIPNALKSIGQTGMNAFKSISWTSLGKNIITGIAGGISGAASKIAQAAKDAAKRALESAKNFLGIHSPSRKAKKEIGEQYDAGVAEGIMDDADVMVSAAKASSREMIDAAQGVVMGSHYQTGAEMFGTGASAQRFGGAAPESTGGNPQGGGEENYTLNVTCEIDGDKVGETSARWVRRKADQGIFPLAGMA